MRKVLLVLGGVILIALAGMVAVVVIVNLPAPLRPVYELPKSSSLQLEHVAIVDPRDGSLSPDMTIRMEAGAIVDVSPWDAASADAAVPIIDLRGKFVVPGYNNMHTHVLQSEDPSPVLALMLSEGVTGFRQMAGSDRMLRDRQEHRLALTEATPAALQVPGDLLTPFNVASPEDARAVVAHQREAGADFVKLGLVPADAFWAALEAASEEGMTILGHLPPGIDPVRASSMGFRSIEHLGPGNGLWVACSSDREELTEQEAAAPAIKPPPVKLPYIDKVFMRWLEGYLETRTVSTNAGEISRLRLALDTFREPTCVEVARAFRKNSTWQVPTLANLKSQNLADDPAFQNDPNRPYMSDRAKRTWEIREQKHRKIPSPALALYHRLYDEQLKMTRLFAEAGVPMMTGTDGGASITPVHRLGFEFEELSRAGLTPLMILQMTTINPAIYLGRTDTMGLVAPGYNADLVILDANPIESADNLQRLAGVVRAGFYYSRSDLDTMRASVMNGE